ncbi:hypothetical protein VVD49_04005 [Uliginosibacterium sp. H3]|uniref:Nitrogen fixation protein FixH n=1 Tax=Uliginosibacterium silvisoli TaxID=3114758 RepID=A0ABU6K1G2_9RHOO|nr:hypothetical protein [Uliginosibacterium sp. H3]
MNSAATDEVHANGAPWWRQGWCWLVIAGPLAVVIAGSITIVIAYSDADTLSPVYISEHVRMQADRRVANSLLPAEAVSKGAVVHSGATK